MVQIGMTCNILKAWKILKINGKVFLMVDYIFMNILECNEMLIIFHRFNKLWIPLDSFNHYHLNAMKIFMKCGK